uniref:Uncharacterized protein n=1 Tax=Nelumbo nucifera TaxID=4432 RepID=A0A822XU83_NELNU|nr:TPA_asm: hypothetical protein HUJ06_025403 [Nelumbo nucifera]
MSSTKTATMGSRLDKLEVDVHKSAIGIGSPAPPVEMLRWRDQTRVIPSAEEVPSPNTPTPSFCHFRIGSSLLGL